MATYAVEFSGYQSGKYSGTYYVRATVNDVYDSATNTSTLSISKVEFKAPYAFYTCSVAGKVTINGTVCVDYESNGTVAISKNAYKTCSSKTSATVTVQHSSDGTASAVIGIAKPDLAGAQSKFYISYLDGTYYNVGVNAPQTSTISLAVQASTLTVNPNSGTWEGSTSTQTFSQAPGTTKAISNPTRSGYIFNRWNLSGGGSFSDGTYTFNGSNGTLAAVWDSIVTYDANGGSDAPDPQTKVNGQTLVLSDEQPTRDGYSFMGWATAPDASTASYQPGGNYTANVSVTLYAVWRAVTYTASITDSERGIVVNVLRTSSPIGGGAVGAINNGDTLYYNDVVRISWSVDSGYQADTLTVNGVDVSSLSPAEKIVEVKQNLVVVMTVKLGAIVYINNEPYQAFIWNGVSWEQYEAYIGNGASWDAY